MRSVVESVPTLLEGSVPPGWVCLSLSPVGAFPPGGRVAAIALDATSRSFWALGATAASSYSAMSGPETLFAASAQQWGR